MSDTTQPRPPFTAALMATWPLFLGVGILVLGNGLQGSLLGVRATLEGFGDAEAGMIMAGFYGGFLLGSLIVPGLVRRVGHVRVFGALASLASAAVLLHTVAVYVPVWIAIRLVTGFCFAGLFIVAESWLNDRATNETRGQLLAAYMVVVNGGMAAGQFLLTVSDPAGFVLFALVSILISLALLPMMLGASAQPAFAAPGSMALGRLIRTAPSGVVGTFLSGFAHSSLLTLTAVYATSIGLTVPQIALMMAALLTGGVVLQFPLGRMSDRIDRRKVILVMALGGGLACAALLWGATGPVWMPVLIAAVIGGISFPLYAICVAYVNDYLKPEEMVAGSAALYVVFGVGATLGPLVAGVSMELLGPAGFPLYLVAAHAILAVFVVIRMGVRESLPVSEQTAYAPMPLRPTAMVAQMNPEASYDPEPGEPVQGGPLIETPPIPEIEAPAAPGTAPDEAPRS